MTDKDVPALAVGSRPKTRRILLIATLAVCLLTIPATAVLWVSTSIATFDAQWIKKETRSADGIQASPESQKFVDAHIESERAAGRDISISQVKIAVLTGPEGDSKVYLIWSGDRAPAKLLVVDRHQLAVHSSAIGLQTTATAATSTPSIDRSARGGANSDGRLEIRRSDCVDAWYTSPGKPLYLASCTELWRSGTSLEWIYHHFAEAKTSPEHDTTLITSMVVRSRIQQQLRTQTRGPESVASCNNSGTAVVLASVEKISGTPVNPALRVPSNVCAGYRDLLKVAETQVGARTDTSAQKKNMISATGSYWTLQPSISPAWEDYAWAQTETCQPAILVGCRGARIDERTYVDRMW